MINKEMARDYLQRAKWCLDEAILPRERKDYAGTARRSQEALELAAKALLRAHAIEYPREHDVSEALTEQETKIPSRNLSRDRTASSPRKRTRFDPRSRHVWA